jgi:hypothetical protein
VASKGEETPDSDIALRELADALEGMRRNLAGG